jgi:hypothetical protein
VVVLKISLEMQTQVVVVVVVTKLAVQVLLFFVTQQPRLLQLALV